MKKILCFLHSFEPGGVERTALRLCAQLRGDGAAVEILVGRDEGVMRADVRDLAIRFLRPSAFPIRWIETLWMIFWLPRVVRKTRPDILFCAGNSYTIVAVAMKMLLGRACPRIAAKISNDLTRSDMPRAIRWFYHRWCRLQGRLIDHWIALSPAMGEQSTIVLGIDADRIEVIPDSVLDADRHQALIRAGRQARNTRQPGRRFLAAGRLVPQKNFDLLLEGFAQGAQPRDRLVILGDGPERQRLQRKIDRLGLADRVHMPGHCHAIESYIACSDILVLTSRYEGLPAVIVEAMAAGLGIIATNCCASMLDLVGKQYPGQVITTQSSGALALAIALYRVPDPENGEGGPAAAFRVETVAPAYRAAFARLSMVSAVEAVSLPIETPA